MNESFDQRFPPQRFRVDTTARRWVIIGFLPPETQREFWNRVKNGYPDIVEMRRAGAELIKQFNAVFKIPEDRYNEIMGISE